VEPELSGSAVTGAAMESLLNRYRNITVLLLVIFAQLVLLAVQVKNDQDVRIIRVWTVSAITPVARVAEWLRGGSVGIVRNYITLHDADEENRRLRKELGQLKMDNIFLRNELSTADRAKALQVFQAQIQSRTIAANIISIGAGSNSKVVFVSRGSTEGVMRGMAVVTPDGIVGKVIAAYPTASEVELITDADFGAGVVSQKTQVHGTLKGQGTPLCKVDYVPYEDKVEVGEMFYTSGDDRVFPRGFPVGVVKSVQQAIPFKEIMVEPAGLKHGLEDVLIILNGVHQEIPEVAPAQQPLYIGTAPPASGQPAADQQTAPNGTEADKLRNLYKSAGDAQNYTFGDSGVGARAPDFTKLPVNGKVPPPAAPGQVQPPSGQKPATGPATSPVNPGAPPAGRTAAPVTPAPATPVAPPGAKPAETPRRENPAAKPVETPRRENQAAGAGPGGPPHE
jgi:rod shape-determining protein MreC